MSRTASTARASARARRAAMNTGRSLLERWAATARRRERGRHPRRSCAGSRHHRQGADPEHTARMERRRRLQDRAAGSRAARAIAALRPVRRVRDRRRTADEHGVFGARRGGAGRSVGKNVQMVLRCGRKWDRKPHNGPGWRGSSHSSTSARTFFRRSSCAMAFEGTADYTLDAKNRLTVPARYRAALASGVVLAKGLDACVGDLDARRTTRPSRPRALESFHPLSPEAPQAQHVLLGQLAARPSSTRPAA